jgi:hypothetical protein
MKNRSFADVKDGAGESSKVQPWGRGLQWRVPVYYG